MSCLEFSYSKIIYIHSKIMDIKLHDFRTCYNSDIFLLTFEIEIYFFYSVWFFFWSLIFINKSCLIILKHCLIIVSAFELPGLIQAEDSWDRRRQMKRRTTAIWDICLELSETKQVARGYASCEMSRTAWIRTLPEDHLSFLKGKLKNHSETSLFRLFII